MLNDDSYQLAVYVYAGAAALMLLYLAWWLAQYLRPTWVALVILVLAALLLTPAHPAAGITTMAPALIVAVFQFFTEGYQAAVYALRLLGYATAGAVMLAFLLAATVLRGRSAPRRNREDKACAKIANSP